jgi:hypothetical protein
MDDLTRIQIRVTSAHQVDERLNAAVALLQKPEISSRRGILVVRAEPGYYIVSLSDEVPFGLSRELIL